MRACRRASFATVMCLPLLAAPLAGCQTNEGNYGIGGAAIGALACGAIGGAVFHSTAGALGSAAACGAAGYFVGSAIGRRLDERDRAVAQSATQRVLAQPVSYGGRTDVVRPRVRPATWTSNHNTGTRGSASVVEATKEPGGGECRIVREVAYIKGHEESQESKYCRGTDGAWNAA